MPDYQKSRRNHLDDKFYDDLRRRVLERDGWRCQRCGTRCNLHVHHLVFRSRSGPDHETNLITLCGACHAVAHGAIPDICKD